MNKTTHIKAIHIAIVLAGIWIATLAFALEGAVVDIRIEGNKRVDSETVKSYLETKVGERYFPEKVKKDIKNIYAQGFFKDVRVEGEQTPAGVILYYIVVEKPMITNVSYTGNKAVDKEDIDKALTIKAHQVLDENKIIESEKIIKILYEKKGYYLVNITSHIEPDGEGKVKIKLTIEENDKVKVRKVVFLGNKAFKDEELQKAIATRPVNALSFMGKTGIFIDEEFDNDIYRLNMFYLNDGYLDIKIDPPQVFLSPDKKDVTVVYNITEGPQYFAGKIDIDGDLIKDKKELMALLTLKEGGVYSYGKLRSDIQALTDAYANEGYADANVVPRSKIDREKHIVDLTYQIVKGVKIYIERIDITGNDKTRDMVIRRQLKLVEGDLYSASAIKESERNINRLGFFKSVKMVPSPGSRPELRNLTVIVEEQSTGSISAGAGFSTTEDFMFNAQISQKNLFGRGQSLGASVNYGKSTQSAMFTFTDPYIFDTRFTFQTMVNFQYRSYTSFDRRDAGGSLTVGHLMPRSDLTRAFATYLWQETNLSNFPTQYTIMDRLPQNYTTSSITFSLRRNTANNYLDPTSGSILSGSVEFAGGILGGDNEFTKYEASYNYYRPVYWQTYLAFRANVGFFNQNQGDRLLISERYYLGGIYDLRGYNTRTVGPRYPSDDPGNSDIIIGGNKQAVISLDYVIPLYIPMGLKAVVFVDTGNAFNDDEQIDPTNFRSDYGFGVRWMSPMGPLRFELGFPIQPKHGEDPQVFQFAIGTPLQ